MTALFVWIILSAIPVLLIVAELRARRKQKRKEDPEKIEHLSILLGCIGLAVAWAAQQGGVA